MVSKQRIEKNIYAIYLSGRELPIRVIYRQTSEDIEVLLSHLNKHYKRINAQPYFNPGEVSAKRVSEKRAKELEARLIQN